jgi:hypothetical protein
MTAGQCGTRRVGAAATEKVERERLPKLRRDPRTGVYRPE